MLRSSRACVVCLLNGLLLASLSWAQGEPRLINEHSLGSIPFVTGKPFAARLSPDGRFVLYPQEAPNPDKTELVLKDLAKGAAISIVGPALPRGYETVCTRFNLFSADSAQMVVLDIPDAGGRTSIRIYDVSTGKLRDGLLTSQVPARHFWAKFDRTGKKLIVNDGTALAIAALPDLHLQPLKATGMLQSVSPTEDLIAVAEFSRDGEHKTRLSLYDVAKDKPLAELPVHPRNTRLNDFESQWTADGRYLYYCDLEEEADSGRTIAGTRIWDRKEGKVVGFLQNMLPVGRGPTPTSVILAMAHAEASRAYVYDAERKAGWELGGLDIHLIHGWGNRLVYMKAGDNRVYVAEIQMPME